MKLEWVVGALFDGDSGNMRHGVADWTKAFFNELYTPYAACSGRVSSLTGKVLIDVSYP